MTVISEREKYQLCWANEQYGAYSPGEQALKLFNQMVRFKPGTTLVDIGCGVGRASAALAKKGYQVTMLDFASEAALDEAACELPYLDQDITDFWPQQTWDWGYCCDVMEHLPPAQVHVALERITLHCDQVFFTIHFGPDHFGSVVGHPLHLTVQPFLWWCRNLQMWGKLIDARDLMGMGAFRLESKRDRAS